MPATTIETRIIETRIFCPEPLSSGGAVTLDAPDAHHLCTVLRLRSGQSVALFNPRDGAWCGELTELSKNRAVVCLKGCIQKPEDTLPDIWLLFAPLKKQPLDFMVEKACELGCSRLVPVVTGRTNKTQFNRARMMTRSKEASEQCGRLSVAEVAEAVRLDRFLDDWPARRRLLVCAEFGVAEPIQSALARLKNAQEQKKSDPWAILVGPEGGFLKSELEALSKLPYVTTVGLGPRILRAETAALVALAAWQAVLGDGDRRPDDNLA